MTRLLGRVVHKSLELLRRQEALQLLVDGLHTLHVLRTRQAFLTESGVLEMHAIEGVDTERITNT